MAGTGQGSKREATDYLIQEINNFNPLHLRLAEPEIVMICRAILLAARAEQDHNDNDNDIDPPTSDVLLLMSAFRHGVAEHWALQAVLPVVDQMSILPTTIEGNRRQFTRKFAKAILRRRLEAKHTQNRMRIFQGFT
ncbi:unnamed protein product [Zymoseptoria tritici ST99CH_1A5]|uniref:Uncharacterized protein n=1 Tax=Zymoseptoria tritici ST99CH_1A5 TaxID=1276529 RepID=A0A1Y6M3L8_ZYMTR|nr:unnamed protein product [Zymoseptoria tritici ST99CH_1A5]